MLLSQSNQSGPSSKGPNDSRLEDALIEYLDTNQTQIHWYVVICNLKQMGERIGYTTYHYKCCLDRLIGYFCPNLCTNCNGNHDSRWNSQVFHDTHSPGTSCGQSENGLKTLTRTVNMSLPNIMNQLQALGMVEMEAAKLGWLCGGKARPAIPSCVSQTQSSPAAESGDCQLHIKV